jgi:hypothetical protein
VTGVFREHRRFGPFEVAVMPIGAYDPWIRNHCTPEQAVTMADAAGARLFVRVQTFELSREPVPSRSSGCRMPWSGKPTGSPCAKSVRRSSFPADRG